MFKKQFLYVLFFCAPSLSCMDLTPFSINDLPSKMSNVIIKNISQNGDLRDILHFGSTCKEQYGKFSTNALIRFNPKIVITKMNTRQFRTAILATIVTLTPDECKKIHYELLSDTEKRLTLDEMINWNGSCKYTITELFKKECFKYSGDDIVPQLKTLLNQGADVNSIVSPVYKNTALMHFISFNFYNTLYPSSRDAITLLLKHNANPNTYSVYGESPLSMCKKIKDPIYAEILKQQLIDAGAQEDFDEDDDSSEN